jgi:hypothetical protein
MNKVTIKRTVRRIALVENYSLSAIEQIRYLPGGVPAG